MGSETSDKPYPFDPADACDYAVQLLQKYLLDHPRIDPTGLEARLRAAISNAFHFGEAPESFRVNAEWVETRFGWFRDTYMPLPPERPIQQRAEPEIGSGDEPSTDSEFDWVTTAILDHPPKPTSKPGRPIDYPWLQRHVIWFYYTRLNRSAEEIQQLIPGKRHGAALDPRTIKKIAAEFEAHSRTLILARRVGTLLTWPITLGVTLARWLTRYRDPTAYTALATLLIVLVVLHRKPSPVEARPPWVLRRMPIESTASPTRAPKSVRVAERSDFLSRIHLDASGLCPVSAAGQIFDWSRQEEVELDGKKSGALSNDWCKIMLVGEGNLGEVFYLRRVWLSDATRVAFVGVGGEFYHEDPAGYRIDLAQADVLDTQEFKDKSRPFMEDRDSDGLPDSLEPSLGLNPDLPNSDTDTLNDGYEVLKLRTDPLHADTDGDQISDGDEIAGHRNPLLPDNYEALEQSQTKNCPDFLAVFAWDVGPQGTGRNIQWSVFENLNDDPCLWQWRSVARPLGPRFFTRRQWSDGLIEAHVFGPSVYPVMAPPPTADRCGHRTIGFLPEARANKGGTIRNPPNDVLFGRLPPVDGSNFADPAATEVRGGTVFYPNGAIFVYPPRCPP